MIGSQPRLKYAGVTEVGGGVERSPDATDTPIDPRLFDRVPGYVPKVDR